MSIFFRKLFQKNEKTDIPIKTKEILTSVNNKLLITNLNPGLDRLSPRNNVRESLKSQDCK